MDRRKSPLAGMVIIIHFQNGVDFWGLYDLKTDPSEMNNLYEEGAYAELIQT